MDSWQLVSTGEGHTEQLGRLLGSILTFPVLILLQGDLGTGKTVLARGIARGLGVAEGIPVTSPTFTLMNHYLARMDLYHFDLYRLNSPDDLVDIGFDEYAFGRGVALVEWPEKLESPEQEGLWISLERQGETQRLFKFHAAGTEAGRVLGELRNQSL